MITILHRETPKSDYIIYDGPLDQVISADVRNVAQISIEGVKISDV